MNSQRIEFKVEFASGEAEYVIGEGSNDTLALINAVAKSQRYDRKTGLRDHVTGVEFWERKR